MQPGLSNNAECRQYALDKRIRGTTLGFVLEPNVTQDNPRVKSNNAP
jgi:hypothetical protein